MKSIREGKANLKDAYGIIKDGEAYLLNAHIGPYSHGSSFNHDSLRTRKLLLHRQELQKLMGKTQLKGLTLIPTRLYFRHGRVKCELAVAKGKQDWDKRETERRREDEREAGAGDRARPAQVGPNHHNLSNLGIITHEDESCIRQARPRRQPTAGDLCPGCRGEEASSQTGNQADDRKQRRGQGDGERSKQRRIRCRELRDGLAARPCRSCKAERILLVGLAKLTTAESTQSGGGSGPLCQAAQAARKSRSPFRRGLDSLAATRALVEGAYIGDFDPDTDRSDRKDQSIEQLTIVAGSGVKEAAVEAGLRGGRGSG